MSSSNVNSYNFPTNSITNPNSIVELDLNAPFSFFEFLNYTNSKLNAMQFNELYMEYITSWNSIKNSSESETQIEIVNRYTELLKEITLKYATAEEKRFISNIDFSDPLDLDIVLPFYSKKIIDICNFYCNKRELIKNKTEKVKTKGSENSIKKALYETITDVIFTDVIEVVPKQNPINLDALYRDLHIEVEELYDLYTNYFDNDPDLTYSDYDVKSDLRKNYYIANINGIDGNIFYNLDLAIKNQLFENIRVFLSEFGKNFTINFDLNSVNLNCSVGEPLYSLVSKNKNAAAKIVSLRYSLIEKYIGCDFYYIVTGDTIDSYTFERLFKADNPSGNLLNRHFPTTATIEEESDLQSCRRIGLFFTPEKNSILYFSSSENTYKVDSSKLEPNKLYIFPDPNIYGNTSGLTRNYYESYPLMHIQDYTTTVRNQSYNESNGDIRLTPKDQAFYPYYSQNQAENLLTGLDSLSVNFSNIFDSGLIERWTSDIYGNEFCLIKDTTKRPLIDTTFDDQKTINVCIDFDGGPIKFDHSGELPEQSIPSNASWVYPNVWASDYYYNLLIDGGFGGTPMGIMWHGLFSRLYIDGLSIARTEKPESVFSIWFNPNALNTNLVLLDGYQYNVEIYTMDLNKNTTSYDTSIDATIDGLYYDENYNTYASVNKTMDGNPNLEDGVLKPNFLKNSQYTLSAYILSSIKYAEYDGGYIIDTCDEEFDFNNQTNFIIKERFTNNYTISGEFDVNQEIIQTLFGSIYTKNVVTKQIEPLSASMAVQFDKYQPHIKNEIYNLVEDFNIYNDFIWIRTKNYMIFDKIYFYENKFEDAATTTNVLSNLNGTNIISDPFIFEDRDYCMIASLSLGNLNTIKNQTIVPKVKKYSYTNNSLSDIYDGEEDINLYSTLTSVNYKYKFINRPKLIHNTRNEVYGIVSTIEDQNGFPTIYKQTFKYNESSIYDKKCSMIEINIDDFIGTINFHDNSTFNSVDIAFTDLSGSNYIINQYENSINYL